MTDNTPVILGISAFSILIIVSMGVYNFIDQERHEKVMDKLNDIQIEIEQSGSTENETENDLEKWAIDNFKTVYYKKITNDTSTGYSEYASMDPLDDSYVICINNDKIKSCVLVNKDE